MLRRELYAAVLVFVIAIGFRWHRLSDSLWLDEMTTVTDYVAQPWQRTIAPKPGEYLPNDHILHTVLTKLTYDAFGDPVPIDERLLRLPALLAGCLLPIALAWPTRRAYPVFSLLVAVLAAAHPWLIVFATEARGYALMMLLGTLATNCLPLMTRVNFADRRGAGLPLRETTPAGREGTSLFNTAATARRIGVGAWAYPLLLAAAIYTVPLAVLIVPAHVMVARRRWIVPGLTALAVTAVLYAPALGAMIQYYRHPFAATLTYRVFLDQLPRFALAGDRVPIDGSTGSIFWALPVLSIVGGSIALWTRPAARPLLVTLLVTIVIGGLMPLVSPSTAEVRFAVWIAPLLCLCLVAVLTLPFSPAAPSPGLRLARSSRTPGEGRGEGDSNDPTHGESGSSVDPRHPNPLPEYRERGQEPRTEGTPVLSGRAAGRLTDLLPKFAAVAVGVVLAAMMVSFDLHLRTTQPIRELLQSADHNAPPDVEIVVAYLGCRESVGLYGQNSSHHLTPALTTAEFVDAVQTARRRTGRMPWVVIYFPGVAAARSGSDPETRGLWSALNRNFHPVITLPARADHPSVWAPNDDGTTMSLAIRK